MINYRKKLGTAWWGALRKEAIGYGKIVFDDLQFSIGDFSIKYIDVLGMDLEKGVFMVVNCSKRKSYKFLIDSKSGRVRATQKVFDILKEKLEGQKQERTISFLKDLPKLYKEIEFDDISSRTGLERVDLMNIIERLILDGELNAEIRGNVLKLKKEIGLDASPKSYESKTPKIQESDKREGHLIFVSYATKDAKLYKIPKLAHKLETFKEIGEVLYWQEDMHDSIIEYMNDNLGKCEVVLLFCSPNALNSVPVKKEWMAAEALKKPIIPIFIKPEHIPPLLSDRLGYEFDSFDLQKNVQEIYELILKKIVN